MNANKKFYSTVGIFTIGGLFLWSINDEKIMNVFKKEDSLTDQVTNVASDTVKSATDAASDAANSVKNAASGAATYVTDTVSGATASATNAVSGAANIMQPAKEPYPPELPSTSRPAPEYPTPAAPEYPTPAAPAPAYPPVEYQEQVPLPTVPNQSQAPAPAYPPVEYQEQVPLPTVPNQSQAPMTAPAYPPSPTPQPQTGGTRRHASANKTRRCKHCNHEY